MNASEWLENIQQYYLTVRDVLAIPTGQEVVLSRVRPTVDHRSALCLKQTRFHRETASSGVFDNDTVYASNVTFNPFDQNAYIQFKGEFLVLPSHIENLPNIVEDTEPWYFRPYTGPDQVLIMTHTEPEI